MIGIYKIENLVNGKVYIGQSININQRWSKHKADLRHNNHDNVHLQNSWNKYGEDSFSFEVIENCSEQELNDKEIYWINEYNSYEREFGYNLTLGGAGTKLLHPMLQFDLSGKFIKEWENGTIASSQLNINPATLYGCANKKYKHAGRFIWIYKEDYENEESLKWYLENQKMQNVLQYDLYGNLLKIWTCCADIVKELKFNPIQCLLHITKTCNGYIFKYVNDPLVIDKQYCEIVRNIISIINRKPFYQIDSNGKIVNYYHTLNEAERDGWAERCVNECCRGLRNVYKGYIWVYETDINMITKEYCDKKFSADKTPKYYKVLRYDLNHELIKEYPYLQRVKDDGFNENNVRDACLGRINYKNSIWEFGEEVDNPLNKPVLQYDLFGNLLNRFKSVSEASKELNIQEMNIISVCNHRTLSTFNYIFKYENDDFEITKEYCKEVRERSQFYFKPIVCLDLNDKFIKIYKNKADIKKDGFDIQEIRKCCRRTKDYYKNYHWMYLEDYDESMII